MSIISKLLKFFSSFITNNKPTTEINNPTPTPAVEIKPEYSGMLYAKDDSQRIKDELVQLQDHNPGLHDLIMDLYKWIGKELNKDTVITMIFRTQAEQDTIYNYSDEYKKKPWRSPHQLMHSIDLRSRIYTDEEISKIVKYLNDKYNKSNYYSWTAKAHAVPGNAMHFHIQYVKK